jgi:hypothetical protein
LRPAERRIALPVVGGGVDHHALHRGPAVVAGQAGGSAIIAVWHRDATAIGVEQDLGGIEAHSVVGIPWPGSTIAVELARREAGDEHVPIDPAGNRTYHFASKRR